MYKNSSIVHFGAVLYRIRNAHVCSRLALNPKKSEWKFAKIPQKCFRDIHRHLPDVFSKYLYKKELKLSSNGPFFSGAGHRLNSHETSQLDKSRREKCQNNNTNVKPCLYLPMRGTKKASRPNIFTLRGNLKSFNESSNFTNTLLLSHMPRTECWKNFRQVSNQIPDSYWLKIQWGHSNSGFLLAGFDRNAGDWFFLATFDWMNFANMLSKWSSFLKKLPCCEKRFLQN